MEATCVILAGGKSSRLGRAKLLEPVGTESLLERVLGIVSPLCKEVLIVTAREQSIPVLTHRTGVRTVVDLFPEKGPLVGIYSGIKESADQYNLVVATDMPFLNPQLLGYLLEISGGYDMVVPRTKEKLQPLHAVYSRECLPAIKAMIDADNLSLNTLAASVKTRYVEEEEISRYDPQHLSFFNINTQQDLERARELIKGESKH